MNKIILCEGETDAILLSYYLDAIAGSHDDQCTCRGRFRDHSDIHGILAGEGITAASGYDRKSEEAAEQGSED